MVKFRAKRHICLEMVNLVHIHSYYKSSCHFYSKCSPFCNSAKLSGARVNSKFPSRSFLTSVLPSEDSLVKALALVVSSFD